MKNNFDLKKFLVENKLTTNSKALSEINRLAEADGKGIVITSSNQLAKLLTETVGDTGSFEVSISQSPAEFSEYLDKYAKKGSNGKLTVIKNPAELADTLTIWCRDNNYDKITYVPIGGTNRVGYLKAVNTKVEHAENIFMEVYPNSQNENSRQLDENQLDTVKSMINHEGFEIIELSDVNSTEDHLKHGVKKAVVMQGADNQKTGVTVVVPNDDDGNKLLQSIKDQLKSNSPIGNYKGSSQKILEIPG